MPDQKLEETIIRLAQQQQSRAEIIRVLIAQGYEAPNIEEAINALYYSGKLTSDISNVIERENIRTLDVAVEKKQPEALPLLFRIRVWVRLHKVSAIGVSVFFLTLLAGIGGGWWGYHTSPTVVLNKALTKFAESSLISYTASGTLQLQAQDTTSFSSEGVMAITSSPRAVASVTFARNTDTQWDIDIVHTEENTIFIRLKKGPLPYSFIYNKWIQIGESPTDTQSLEQLGLGGLFSHMGIMRVFPNNFSSVWYSLSSVPGAYTKITQEEKPQPSCASSYQVLFDEQRIAQGMSLLAGADIRVLSFLAQSPWRVCLNSDNAILALTMEVPAKMSGVTGIITVSLTTPKTLPSFTVDTPATPLATIMEWVKEGKQK